MFRIILSIFILSITTFSTRASFAADKEADGHQRAARKASIGAAEEKDLDEEMRQITLALAMRQVKVGAVSEPKHGKGGGSKTQRRNTWKQQQKTEREEAAARSRQKAAAKAKKAKGHAKGGRGARAADRRGGRGKATTSKRGAGKGGRS